MPWQPMQVEFLLAPADGSPTTAAARAGVAMTANNKTLAEDARSVVSRLINSSGMAFFLKINFPSKFSIVSPQLAGG
jgi:hypothetical protein